ncbi:hypothetical protein M0804_011842 [Polistes exclamans]|nr:hypothetical protein M0804_011842 [Polistes exclamans]
MDQTLKTFNSVNNRIQFTMEVENNGTLPFLDMNIIRNEDGSIVTNWYVKPTSSGRCINYNSNHPMSQKIGVIKGLLFRAMTLSSKKFHIENKKRIELILKNNNYPTSLIHMVFRQTKQKLKKRLEQHKNDCKSTNAQKSNITALAEHHFITGHKFKFDETDILDREDNWYKRNISERLWLVPVFAELSTLTSSIFVGCLFLFVIMQSIVDFCPLVFSSFMAQKLVSLSLLSKVVSSSKRFFILLTILLPILTLKSPSITVSSCLAGQAWLDQDPWDLAALKVKLRAHGDAGIVPEESC